MPGELLLVAGLLLMAAAATLLVTARRLRGRVRRAHWLLTRTSLAAAEARRASIMLAGSEIVGYLLGGIARNGEADPDAAR